MANKTNGVNKGKRAAAESLTAAERETVQTVLEGRLCGEFHALEAAFPNVPKTELLRQGLIRLVSEWRASGELVIKSMPGAAVA